MKIPVMDGIDEQYIASSRLETRLLSHGLPDDVPIIFLHGNLSSATWWEEVLVTVPYGYYGIAYDQRGFGSAASDKKIDATRGMGDLSDDLAALMDVLNIEQAHLVGSSMGGSVLWRFLMDYPERCLTVTLVAPGSPYGFGATYGKEGIPIYGDFAGSGAGLINGQFVAQLKAKDRSDILLVSPRRQLKRLWNTGSTPYRIEELLSATLSIHIGERDYPGDYVKSPNWPFFAPGRWGINNALSPKYLKHPSNLYHLSEKPPILWIRGDRDTSVSDTSLSDYAMRGKMGLVPAYPGEEKYPLQPMIQQTRAVLTEYRLHGGEFSELVIRSAGHIPYINRLSDFNRYLHQFIMAND